MSKQPDLFWSNSQDTEAEVARLVELIDERAAEWDFEQCIVYRGQECRNL